MRYLKMTHIEVIRSFPFDVETNYLFNADLIEVALSIVQLKGNPTIPHAHWQCNEVGSSATLADLAPNNFTGTISGDLTFVAGKLNNAKYFDGATFVDFTNVLTWDRTQAFAFEMWIKTTDTAGYIYQQITTPGGQLKGFGLSLDAGKLRFSLFGNNTNNLVVECNTLVNDNSFYHVVINYDGSSLAAGVNFYINKVVQPKTVIEDTLGVTIANGANFRIGGFAGGNYTGLLDEMLFYTRTLTQSEIDYRYNSGTGTESLIDGYSVAKPTIENASPVLFDGFIEEFEETATIPARTGIKYQLSIDGGNTWQYWTGSAWATITAGQTNTYYYANEANTAAEVDANINTIARSGNFIFRAFLSSNDSYYTPELDELTITYHKEEEVSVYTMYSKFNSCTGT